MLCGALSFYIPRRVVSSVASMGLRNTLVNRKGTKSTSETRRKTTKLIHQADGSVTVSLERKATVEASCRPCISTAVHTFWVFM